MRANRRLLRNLLSTSIVIAVAGCASAPVSEAPQNGQQVTALASEGRLSNLDIARAEFSRGNYGNAIQYLEKELTQKPASVAALNGLGACYDQLGRYEVAQRYYFRALDLAPESSQTLSNIGYSYLQQGRHREAVAVLELALQKNDGNQVAANNLELAKSGLVANASPVQVARSTNNGSQIDQTDFTTLLSLLQGAGGAAATTLAGTDESAPDDVAVVAGSDSRSSSAVATVSAADTGASTLIRLPQPTAEDLTASAEEEPGVSEALSAAEVAPQIPEAESPPPAEVAKNSVVIEPEPRPEQQEAEEASTETPVAEVDVPEALEESPTTLSPAPEGQSAELALVTEQAAVVVPTLEPVAGDSVPADLTSESEPEPEPELPQLTLTIIDTPQLDPARVSDRPATIADLPAPLNLVIENGNGVKGIARATSNLLAQEKLDIKRVRDAEHFDYAQTVIYYRPELYPYAQELAASLNLSCELLPSEQLADGTDVQVVLGHDFASQVNVQNGGLAFESSPSSDYLASTLRLEVANGNGVNGMAARVRKYLREQGSNVIGIYDADNFNYDETLLYYRSGSRIAAEGLAARLPLAGIRLIETENLRFETDARLVIGKDYLPYDNLVMN